MPRLSQLSQLGTVNHLTAGGIPGDAQCARRDPPSDRVVADSEQAGRFTNP